ncbi:MAG: flagellar biosynthesis protein FlhB [Deltaproteobacteria bacterium]|nr:flagellar biosynthesis protein FlhB [Deltaproteobacteria bacterium]
MAEESFSERTEQATPKRREEARRKGQVAKSREIPSLFVLMGGASILFLFGSYLYRHLSDLMIKSFTQVGALSFSLDTVQILNVELIHSLFLILSPILITVLVLSVLSHYVQSGTLIAPEALKWDWSKVNLLKGLKRLLSIQSLAELIKSLLKFVIVGGIAYVTIKKELPRLSLLMNQEPEAILRYVRSISWDLLLRIGMVMIVLAGMDYLFQRWTYEKSLRMTKQQVKEEFKQTEGDPIAKSRIRSLQRQMARRRMMAEVPKADVIITNPTHLAMAIFYQIKKMEAPKVVAKGSGFIAEKIIEIARNHHIPVIENRPLARILYKTVEVGQMIPSSFYHAVADILAYVYRMKNRTL